MKIEDLMRHALLAGLLAALLFTVEGRPASADCDGGAIQVVRLDQRGLRLDATVTRRGVTHGTFVTDPEGFTLRIVDAEDPATALYSVAEPRTRFVTRLTRTTYDRRGTFPGRLVLKNSLAQRDTVRISLRARGVGLPAGDRSGLRVFVRAGGRCAWTCLAPCSLRGERLQRLICGASAPYAPAPAAGFGTFRAPPSAPPSSLCGVVADSRCEFLLPERCLLPYPSSHFLVPDAATPTGLRARYPPDALPANVDGVHVDPTDWDSYDGFSPGSALLALFADSGAPVDLAASGVAFHTDFNRSLEADHPIVLMEAATGTRVVHFAEMDANTDDVNRKALIIRPGERLQDATRYVVAIRRLVDTNGVPVEPPLAFRLLQDDSMDAEIVRACGPGCAGAIAARRAAMALTLDALADGGLDPTELVLAWEFTTASASALTGWMRTIRDRAFALGTPAFTVASVNDGGGAGFDQNIWVRIEGTFAAPLFMTADAPASRLNLVDGVPVQNGFARVPFVVDVPRSVVGGPAPVSGRPVLWGHGFFADRYQIGNFAGFANQYRAVLAAVDWQGLSIADVGPALLPALEDLSKFHFLTERMHQGLLNHLLLARLMIDRVGGFDSHPAFHVGPANTGIIDTTEVYYAGASQGGIFGLTLLSIAEDIRRGVLLLPTANLGTLTHRSFVNAAFLELLREAYPDRLDEQLLVALTQQLWDRVEPNGYLNHLVSGDLSSPPVPHKVLVVMATHDSDIPNLATEITVRSLGIPQLAPVRRSYFAIPERSAPFEGSAFIEIDPQRGFARCNDPGTPDPGAACITDADCPGPGDPTNRTRCDSGIPPLTNTLPPFNNCAHFCPPDPPPTATAASGRQIDAFLRPEGEVRQFCSGICDPE